MCLCITICAYIWAHIFPTVILQQRVAYISGIVSLHETHVIFVISSQNVYDTSVLGEIQENRLTKCPALGQREAKMAIPPDDQTV